MSHPDEAPITPIDEIESEDLLQRLQAEVIGLAQRLNLTGIQVIALQFHGNHSRRWAVGFGCPYARYGATRKWLLAEDGNDRAQAGAEVFL